MLVQGRTLTRVWALIQGNIVCVPILSYSNLVLILGNKIYTKVHNFEKNTCKIKIISSLLLLLKSIDYKIALAGKFFWCMNSVICKGIQLAGSISLQSKHYSIYN